MSGMLRTMGTAESTHSIDLTDLTEDALISIFHKLDLQSMLMLTRATKKLKHVIEDDFLWMELCEPWESLVDVRTWRAQMDSGKALYRLLHSLNKLVGLWCHRDNNPCGELVYVTWGICSLEGWQVIPGTRDADEEVRFVRIFDVTGKSDGSHKVELVSTREESLNNAQLSGQIVLPSTESPNQFVMEAHDMLCSEPAKNGSGIRLSIANRFFSRPVRETQVWRKVYKRLVVGEASPGQELTGLWTGLYGPHGWEILTISYTDDQFIVGTKVIGDPNVPSGEVTFKGNMGQVPIDFPNLLRIPTSRDQSRRLTKMYRGQGRIALENFLNPTWVQGLLLVEQSGNFYFVWADINFMIRFHRLDLEASFRKQELISTQNATRIAQARRRSGC